MDVREDQPPDRIPKPSNATTPICNVADVFWHELARSLICSLVVVVAIVFSILYAGVHHSSEVLIPSGLHQQLIFEQLVHMRGLSRPGSRYEGWSEEQSFLDADRSLDRFFEVVANPLGQEKITLWQSEKDHLQELGRLPNFLDGGHVDFRHRSENLSWRPGIFVDQSRT